MHLCFVSSSAAVRIGYAMLELPSFPPARPEHPPGQDNLLHQALTSHQTPFLTGAQSSAEVEGLFSGCPQCSSAHPECVLGEVPHQVIR